MAAKREWRGAGYSDYPSVLSCLSAYCTSVINCSPLCLCRLAVYTIASQHREGADPRGDLETR